MASIPIRDVTNEAAAHAPRYDAPYRHFILASLAIGIGGGFLLALLLPLARLLDWHWGTTQSWSVMAQLHGQLLLMGFGGLFVMGMALRIVPRISTRDLAFQPLIPTLIPAVAGYLLLRTIGQPMPDGTARDLALSASAPLLVAASLTFAAIIWTTLLSRDSKAEAAGWFFVLGATALVVGAFINAAQTIDMIRDSRATAPPTRQVALIVVQQFGFLMMFIAGVGSRAIAGLTGQPRRQVAPRAAAVIFAVGVYAFALTMLVAEHRRLSDLLVRVGASGLILTGIGFAMFAWMSGALTPATRVADASKLQFWFVRSAFAWMSVAAAMTIWFGGNAVLDASLPDQFALDAVRHTLTVGVLTNIIIGMSMLIVPEFAGRRLQHPRERWPILALLFAVNTASLARVWPALEGIDWLEDSRYVPITVAAVLAGLAVILFARMFVESVWEQRNPTWARRAANLD